MTKFVGRCDNCKGVGVLLRGDDSARRFCSPECRDFAANPSFCAKCITEATSETAGSLYSVNGIGGMLIERQRRCPECHSIVARRYEGGSFGTGPKAYFRILYASPTTFYSRKLKQEYWPTGWFRWR
jgi:hypothetical protein